MCAQTHHEDDRGRTGLAGMGLIAEVRFNGARAGKVSTDQVQKKRKYQRYMAEQHLTLEAMLSSGGSGAFRYIHCRSF